VTRWRITRLVAAGLVALATVAASSAAGAAEPSTATVVAPYLDMGNDQPGSLYRAISHAHLRAFTAGFVVGHGCTPTWDDGVAIRSDSSVDRVITKARSLGAHVIVSFGGAGGKDLARSCTSPGKLVAAYTAVINRFHLVDLDFDIEGQSLAEPVSIKRRFVAIAALEAKFPRLVVSLTVPIDPNGLDSQVRSLLVAAKADNVRVGLVNIMTMDYGGASINMGRAAISAARATVPQLRTIWPGWTQDRLGITPMIGTNDNVRETFTTADASAVARFARAHHVGRLAFWAIGRDSACPRHFKVPQDNCSGVGAPPLAFTRAFLSH
jgi:chitinase